MFVAGALLYQSSQKQIKICMLVRAHVGDVIIVWRNTPNNTKPNAIWFPITLTDTDLNIQGIQVNIVRMEIVIYRRQRVDYGELYDTACLVPKFACCVVGPSEFFCNDFQLNVQELRLQARFVKGLDCPMLLKWQWDVQGNRKVKYSWHAYIH